MILEEAKAAEGLELGDTHLELNGALRTRANSEAERQTGSPYLVFPD